MSENKKMIQVQHFSRIQEILSCIIKIGGDKLINFVDIETGNTLVVYNPDTNIYDSLIINSLPLGVQYMLIGYMEANKLNHQFIYKAMTPKKLRFQDIVIIASVLNNYSCTYDNNARYTFTNNSNEIVLKSSNDVVINIKAYDLDESLKIIGYCAVFNVSCVLQEDVDLSDDVYC